MDMRRGGGNRTGGYLGALARLTVGRPWTLLLFTVLFLVGAVVVGSGVTDRLLSGGTDDPASQSAQAQDVLDRAFPASQPNFVLLVHDSQGQPVDDPGVAHDGVQLAERLASERSVLGVTSYWQTGASELHSRDSRFALIVAHIPGDETAVSRVFAHIAPHYRGRLGRLVVALGGSAAIQEDIHAAVTEDLQRSEVIALPITLLILILIFGSPVAALLPLAVGIVAILGTNAILRFITDFTEVSIFAQNLTTGLGLGLAIDYALLIVRRYREELDVRLEPREAVAATLATAGRTVIFSALTVAVALAVMMIFPLYFLRSFAYAGIAVVLLAAAAALVLVPALLVLLGRRVNALDLRRLVLRQPSGGGESGPARVSGWYLLATAVMRRAPVVALAATAVLVLVGLPFFHVQLGTADYRELPQSATSRAVQEEIHDGFDSRPTGVIDVVTTNLDDTAANRVALIDYAQRLSALPGVARVQTQFGTYRSGQLFEAAAPADAQRSSDGHSHLSVTPVTGIEDISPQSQDLVRAIRGVSNSLHARVAGQAASLVDSEQAIASRLGLGLAVIVLTTSLLVFLLTGGLLAVLQAIALNALSLTAMFGAVVWVFQEGHLSGLLGFIPTGYIETTLPVLMFCIAFGLSMDYGFFLLSRIKEEHDRTGDHSQAVALGIQRTGGIITAAAIILAVVLGSIGVSRITNTKMLGFGVALALLVDATLVRCFLVPAVMELSGRATWWAPGPLRRLHSRFGRREEGPRLRTSASGHWRPPTTR